MLATESQKIAHLLRRFGFGASEAETAFYGQNGLPGAIDKLLNYESVDEGFNVDPMSLATGKKKKLKIEGVQEWWLMRMVVTRRPLQEKMTLFWHNHFATSADKVTNPQMMLRQNEIFRERATGNFHDLLSAVSKDPAMLLWLDNQYNVKGHANENFAREVMELFTLGIGHYAENDVREGGRAFTGWSFGAQGKRQPKNVKSAKNLEFVERAEQHDDGVKSFLGHQGNLDGDDVLSILCQNPQCAFFLTQKLWSWFVYPDPDQALVSRLSKPFFDSGLDLKLLLRSIMEAPEFYSERAYRRIYKNPVDFTVCTLRQLGYGETTLSDANAAKMLHASQALRISTKAMGMNLLWPPDVSGWKYGSEWVSTGTMVERIHWGQVVFGESSVGAKNRNFELNGDASVLFREDPSPDGIARRLVSIFDAPIPEARMRYLADAAKGAGDSANGAASAVSKLIFAAPEFQFC